MRAVRVVLLKFCHLSVLVLWGVVCRPPYAYAQQAVRVNGLAVEFVGGQAIRGVVNPITVMAVPGSGEFDVNARAIDLDKAVAIQEARNFAQFVASTFGYSSDFSQYNIHISYDEKYRKQGGGSGAATLATGIVAALAGIPVRMDVAITGDITQVGEIKRVDGIAKKVTAALEWGCNTIIVPSANRNDVLALPAIVFERTQIVAASTMGQVLFHAFGTSGPSAQQYAAVAYNRRRALAALANEDYQTASGMLANLVAALPGDLSLEYWKKIADAGHDRLKTAANEYEEGTRLLNEGKALEAVPHLMEAAALVPDNQEYADALKQAQERAKQAAEEEREQLVKETLQRAQDAKNRGDLEVAFSGYQVLTKMEPDNAAYRTERDEALALYLHDLQEEATAEAAAGSLATARALCERILQLAPDRENVKDLLDTCLAEEQAAPVLAGPWEMGPQLSLLQWSYDHEAQGAVARVLTEALGKRTEHKGLCYLTVSRLLSQVGDLTGAQEAYREFVTTAPEGCTSVALDAELSSVVRAGCDALDARNWTKATELSEEVLRDAPGCAIGHLLASHAGLAARGILAANDVELLSKVLSHAVWACKLAPSNPYCHAQAAFIYAVLGRGWEADVHAQLCHELLENNALALRTRVIAAVESGDANTAVDAANTLVMIEPRRGSGYLLRAYAYNLGGDLSEANWSLRQATRYAPPLARHQDLQMRARTLCYLTKEFIPAGQVLNDSLAEAGDFVGAHFGAELPKELLLWPPFVDE